MGALVGLVGLVGGLVLVGPPVAAVCSEKVSPHELLGFGGRGRQGKRFVGVEFKVVEGGVGDGL